MCRQSGFPAKLTPDEGTPCIRSVDTYFEVRVFPYDCFRSEWLIDEFNEWPVYAGDAIIRPSSSLKSDESEMWNGQRNQSKSFEAFIAFEVFANEAWETGKYLVSSLGGWANLSSIGHIDC